MIFGKTQRIGVNFNENIPFETHFINIKVIIIDKRNFSSTPQIFALSPESTIETEDLQYLKSWFLSGFSNQIFLPLGTLTSHDRKKKIVKLSEEKSVSYKYLIVITNMKNQQNRDNVNELYTGLNALIDALRIKKNNTLTTHLKECQSRKLPPALEHKQVQILYNQTPITKPENKPLENRPNWFFESDVLLYEVQT